MNSLVRKVPYKIFHLAKYYPPMPGGIETHVQSLARAQAALGAEVSVLCVNGLVREKSQSLRTKTVYEQDNNVSVTSLGRISSFARLDICPEILEKLKQAINEADSIIHLHTPNPTMLIAWLIAKGIVGRTRYSQKSLVITHHSDIIKQRFLKYALRPIEYLVYKQASCILTDSPEYIEGSKFLRAFKQNIKVLPLGLDCSAYFHPTKAARSYSLELQEKYRAPIWLCVGRIVYYKDRKSG